MAKKDEPLGFVDNILGGKEAVKSLEAKRVEIVKRLSMMESNFTKLSTTLFHNRAILAFANGRIGKIEFGFADQILDAAEEDLVSMHHEIKVFKDLTEKISEILGRIEDSRNVEINLLQIEGYLAKKSSKKSNQSMFTSEFQKELVELHSRSRLVSHSVDAILELKAGK